MSIGIYETIEMSVSSNGICTLTLNRPKVHNAFDESMIADITHALEQLRDDESVRVLSINGSGRSFCAGADLNWMRRTAEYDAQDNFDDAMRMAEMMHALYSFPGPTVAVVHGAVFGGGVGLIACCDIVIADDSTVFSLAEVRLGLIPAVIGPYVVNAMGSRIAKRYILSGERFDTASAYRSGLVHEYAHTDALSQVQKKVFNELLASGPNAQRIAKQLIIDRLSANVSGEIQQHTATLISNLRASQEGREGVSAFLEKRHPGWKQS